MQSVQTVPYRCPTCGTEQFIKLGNGRMDADLRCLKCSDDVDLAAVRADHGWETYPQKRPEVPAYLRAGR